MKQILKQRQGQATVEYLLLIAVVIFLAVSIGRPLGDYLTGLSGAMLGPDDSYYACLMEKAELPGNSVSCQAELDKATTTPLNLPGTGGSGAKAPGGSRSGDSDGSGNNRGGGSDEKVGGGDSDSGAGEESGDRNGGRDSVADRAALSSKHRTGSNVRGGSSAGSDRDQTQAEFVAFRPSSSSTEEEEEEEVGSGRRGLRRKRKRGSGPKFGSEHEGYKQNLNRNRSEFAVAYLGERFVEEEEKESKKVFKSLATASSFAGPRPRGEDPKSTAPGEALPDRAPSEKPEVKQMNLMGFIRYIVLAVLIILVLAFVFSQAMEYQSRD